MHSSPTQKHATALAAAVALYPVLFLLWLLVLEVLLRLTLGVGALDFSIVVPFGYGLGGLLFLTIVAVSPPLIVSALILRAWKLPASSALIAGTFFVAFMIISGVKAAREGTKQAKENIQKLQSYSEDIKKGVTVGTIEASLHETITPETNPHYIHQFKEAFQTAKIEIPLQVTAPGHYRFQLTISGVYPASRWSEAAGTNISAADQKVEKRFEWDATLSPGEQRIIHEIPAARINAATSWVNEANGSISLRLFRLMKLKERLAKLGLPEIKNQSVPPDKLFIEPVLEITQPSGVLPVAWIKARSG